MTHFLLYFHSDFVDDSHSRLSRDTTQISTNVFKIPIKYSTVPLSLNTFLEDIYTIPLILEHHDSYLREKQIRLYSLLLRKFLDTTINLLGILCSKTLVLTLLLNSLKLKMNSYLFSLPLIIVILLFYSLRDFPVFIFYYLAYDNYSID